MGISPPAGYWVTEMGTYSGDPVFADFAFQTERQQAADIVKRYVYSLSLGIEKVFLAFGLAEGFHHSDGYFDHTGLVYDGRGSNDSGAGVKKLSYYTYKKMAEVLEGSDWSSIRTIREDAGIYIYQLTRQGNPIWIAWNDNSSPMNVRITLPGSIETVRITEAVPACETGMEVTGYSEAFRELRGSGSSGYIEYQLGESPVFVVGDASE